MAAPAIGTPVSVLWGGPGYEILVPGTVLATAATWTPDAENDLPEPTDDDRAHIAVTYVSSGQLTTGILHNLPPGTNPGQYRTL